VLGAPPACASARSWPHPTALRPARVACVVLAAPDAADAAELDRHCLASPTLAAFKRPREYRFLDELPKSSSGKILRRVLRDTSHRPRKAAMTHDASTSPLDAASGSATSRSTCPKDEPRDMLAATTARVFEELAPTTRAGRRADRGRRAAFTPAATSRVHGAEPEELRGALERRRAGPAPSRISRASTATLRVG
jgi:hypothetical protein